MILEVYVHISVQYYNTVYRETFALLNFCEFHEFNSIVKISLANFLQLCAWQMVAQKTRLWVWQIVSKTNSNHMALFKYLKKEERFPLPGPLGQLSTKVPSSPLDIHTSL